MEAVRICRGPRHRMKHMLGNPSEIAGVHAGVSVILNPEAPNPKP